MEKKNIKKPAPKKATEKKPAPKKQTTKEKNLVEHLKKIDTILAQISEKGYSLTKCLKINKMSSRTFNEILEADPQLQKRYARACTDRADAIFEEIFDIADDNRGDMKIIFDRNGNAIETEDKEFTSRARLRIDARKWALAKMNPKKYGDKLELSGDEDRPIIHKVLNLGSGKNPENE